MRPLTRNITEKGGEPREPPKLRLDVLDSVSDAITSIKSLVTSRPTEDQPETKPVESEMLRALTLTHRSEATQARENSVLLTRQQEYKLIEILLKAMGFSHAQVDEMILYLEKVIQNSAIPMLPLAAKRTHWRSAVALSKRTVFDIETVSSTIKIQKRIRGFITRRKIQRLGLQQLLTESANMLSESTYADKSKMIARTNLVLSLKNDEEAYGKKLEKLLANSKSLQEKAILAPQDINKIFSNVATLWETHQIILLRLNQLLTTPLPDITGVGFLWAEVAPILNSYAEYLSNSTHAITTHQRLYSQNSKYKLFVNSMKSISFTERLAAPCDRISQYCELIQDILKATPTDHPDAKGLEKAYNMMLNVEKFSKEHLARANNRDLLLELERQIVDDNKLLPEKLASYHRTYLDKYNVALTKRSKEKPMVMVLCSDMLFFLKSSTLHKDQFSVQAVFVFEPSTNVSDRDTKAAPTSTKKKGHPIQTPKALKKLAMLQNSESNTILFGCKDAATQASLLKLIQAQVDSLKIATSVIFGSPIIETLSRAMPNLNLNFVSQPMSAIKHLSEASIFKTPPQKQPEQPKQEQQVPEEESELDFSDLERKVNDLSPKNSPSGQREHREHDKKRTDSHPPPVCDPPEEQRPLDSPEPQPLPRSNSKHRDRTQRDSKSPTDSPRNAKSPKPGRASLVVSPRPETSPTLSISTEPPTPETQPSDDRLRTTSPKDRTNVASARVRISKSFESIKHEGENSATLPLRRMEPPVVENPKKKYYTIDPIIESPAKPKPAMTRAETMIIKVPEDDVVPYESKRKEKKPAFNTDRIVPPFLVYLVEAIEESLNTKGLYRVSALEKDISELRSILIEAAGRGGKHVIKVFTPHTIADVFKLYFRELPEPLLTYDVYQDVTQTLGSYDDDEEGYANKLRASFQKMPLSNYAIAKFLAKHLRRVAEHSEANLMTPTNLAIVFGPSLLYPKERSMADALALPRVYSVVQCMIDHFITVFGEPATRKPPWEINARRKLRHSASLKELPFQRSEMLHTKDPSANFQGEDKRKFTRVKMPAFHQDVKNLFGDQ